MLILQWHLEFSERIITCQTLGGLKTKIKTDPSMRKRSVRGLRQRCPQICVCWQILKYKIVQIQSCIPLCGQQLYKILTTISQNKLDHSTHFISLKVITNPFNFKKTSFYIISHGHDCILQIRHKHTHCPNKV